MSATVNADRFSAYFDQCPILTVPGRTFPVDAHFLEDIVLATGTIHDTHPLRMTHPVVLFRLSSGRRLLLCCSQTKDPHR
jgi:HrpA-like RNA helicase